MGIIHDKCKHVFFITFKADIGLVVLLKFGYNFKFKNWINNF